MTIIGSLKPGDLRTKGKADFAAEKISHDPALFREIWAGMRSDDPGLRMRCADACEKAVRLNKDLLLTMRFEMLQMAKKAEQQEVRWHIAQMLPSIRWNKEEAGGLIKILSGWMADKSNIVKVMSLTAMFEISKPYKDLHSDVLKSMKNLEKDCPPSITARIRQLLDIS